jgi:outer membrane lipoprotein-sorting protein
MLPALMLAAALSGAGPDLLTDAMQRHSKVESYRVTIRSVHADAQEHLRYFFQKPGFVRMEFIHPHAGAVLVYNPTTRRVRLWPFGAGRFPELNLSPTNPLIQSSRQQRVDQSDVGVLLGHMQVLAQGGSLGPVDEQALAGRPVLHLHVTGADDWTVAGVHSYEVWLDAASLFPLKVISRDLQDVIIETVQMEDAEINVPLPMTLFNP